MSKAKSENIGVKKKKSNQLIIEETKHVDYNSRKAAGDATGSDLHAQNNFEERNMKM
jgi:hypothetical protein